MTAAASATLPARPHGVRVWWLAARPATLLLSVIPVMVGTALAVAVKAAQLRLALAALLGAMAIQVGTNLVNDYADFQRGADNRGRLGPLRATQQGWATPRQVVTAAAVAFALATLFGGYIVWHGGWPLLLIGLLSIASGVAYTCGPWPLAYYGLGDIFVFIFFGLVAVCGTFYLQAKTLTSGSVIAAAAIGLLATAVIVVNNLRDRHTDAPAGKRTLAVRFGARFARAEYAALVALAYVLVTAVWLRGGGWGWLLPLATLPWGFEAAQSIRRLEGAALNPWLGRTARLTAAFGTLLTVGVML